MNKKEEKTTKKLDAHRAKMEYLQKSLRYRKYLREVEKKRKQQKSRQLERIDV